jgi:RimJ/RimL family protein N-acetyltransferase
LGWRQPVLEGERLLLRPLAPSDWDALYAVAADPLLWAQHPAHDRWQEPVFRAYFADALAHKGAVVALDKADGAVIGSSRWQAYRPENGGVVEIGWTFLARHCWGTGLNHAMKRLMLAHAFAHVARVELRIGEGNVRSRTACERIGGVLTDRFADGMAAGQPARHLVYEITREAFACGPLAA